MANSHKKQLGCLLANDPYEQYGYGGTYEQQRKAVIDWYKQSPEYEDDCYTFEHEGEVYNPSENEILEKAEALYNDSEHDFDVEYFEEWSEQFSKKFPNGAVICGSVGRWDGNHKIFAKKFDSLWEAMQKCVSGDYEKNYKFVQKRKDGIIYYYESSHDCPVGGTELEIRYITDKGRAYLDRGGNVETLCNVHGYTKGIALSRC